MVPLSSCRPSLLSPLASWSAIGHPKLIHVHLGGPLRHPSTLLGGPLLATIKGPTTRPLPPQPRAVSAPRKGILRGAKTFLSLRDLDEKPQAWLLMTAGVSRVLSEHATFWRSFQLRQIQPLRGCSCTKRVPFRVPFRRKTARNRGWDGEPVFARANSSPRGGPDKTPPKWRPECLPPEIPPVLAAGAKVGGRCLPEAHQRRGRTVSAPRNGAVQRNSAETSEGANVWA
jgi:hypothetical protein